LVGFAALPELHEDFGSIHSFSMGLMSANQSPCSSKLYGKPFVTKKYWTKSGDGRKNAKSGDTRLQSAKLFRLLPLASWGASVEKNKQHCNTMKIKTIILVCSTVCLLLSSGCSLFESSARKHPITDDGKTAYWFDYNSDRRGAFLIPDDKQVKIISEPSPDTAVQNTLKLAGSLNYQSVTGQVSAELSQQIIQLGQRTEMIMFLRETMFRLSEAGNNAGWKPEDYKTLYEQIVAASVTLAQAEKTDADARNAKAQADLLKAQNAIDAVPAMNPTNAPAGSPFSSVPQVNSTNEPAKPKTGK
jgi:hypothetical protein